MAATQFAPAQDCAVLRPGEPLESWRQPLCRMLSHMAANGCLFCRRPTRPRPGGWPTARLPRPKRRSARSAGHQLGQQCCPMRNMANSRPEHKRRALSRGEKHAATREGFRNGPHFEWTTGRAEAQWVSRFQSCSHQDWGRLRRPQSTL